jgi:hypothetical protein
MKSIVFLGDMDGDRIVPKGTAFFLAHKDFVYLVTAKHVATARETFVIHVNMRDGTVGALSVDPESNEDWHLRWFHHPDPNVDVSVMPMHLDFDDMNIDAVAVLSGAAVPRTFPRSEVGCGDVCYALGLYSRHHGQTRLMPACHTGNVAMMADTKEPIPVKNANGGQIIDVVGYLAELSNLPGLSGGPVFVRQALEMNVPIDGGDPVLTTLATPELKLLGIWQGSWSDPDNWEEDVRKRGRQYVQLRMGIVVPAEFLMDLLDLPELLEHRARWLTDENAAEFDVGA